VSTLPNITVVAAASGFVNVPKYRVAASGVVGPPAMTTLQAVELAHPHAQPPKEQELIEAVPITLALGVVAWLSWCERSRYAVKRYEPPP
jgi:hypothetical protein